VDVPGVDARRDAGLSGRTEPAAAQAGHPPARRGAVALALAAVYLLWGSSYLATKVLVTYEPPLLAAGLRFMLAGALLGAFAWWRDGPPRLTPRELRHLAAVAGCTIVVSNGCNVIGLVHVPSNVAALLNVTPALWIAWLGTFGRRATPLPRPARIGLAIGLVGTVMVLSPGEGGSYFTALGWQALVLLGCVGWSLGTIYFRNARIENGPVMFLALQMLAGGAALAGLAPLAGEPLAMQWTAPSVAAFLWLTLMSSCLAYTAYIYLAVHTTTVVVGSYAYVNPAVAAVLGWLVLGERLGPGQLAGMAVILIAVALVTGYVGGPRSRPRAC
jgi:drug/metabolite transporter (DMT)-like permease